MLPQKSGLEEKYPADKTARFPPFLFFHVYPPPPLTSSRRRRRPLDDTCDEPFFYAGWKHAARIHTHIQSPKNTKKKVIPGEQRGEISSAAV